jgi:hypothetical protein
MDLNYCVEYPLVSLTKEYGVSVNILHCATNIIEENQLAS